MIVKYKFPVSGNLVFKAGLLFEYAGYTYEFDVAADDRPDYLNVSTKADAAECAPQITPLENQQSKYFINIKEEPSFSHLKKQLRTLEGMLSLFGIDEINLTHYETSWIPENQNEKEKIKIFSMKSSIQTQKHLPAPLPLDIMARVILASHSGFDWTVPLTFYRKGMFDYKRGFFIEACYDYFFILEYLFADGQHRTKDVKINFRKTAELQEAKLAKLLP